MGYFYDRDGRPIDPRRFDALWSDREYRRVALDYLVDGDEFVAVSTVWIGIDMGFDGGVPLVFETMVFGGDLDGEQERYPTQAAALAGHDQWTARVRDGVSTITDDDDGSSVTE